MMETLVALAAHLERFQPPAKIVVWAHNSHLGNASATQMSERGEFNLGQLVRERFEHDAVLIGFTTHTGTVTAAADWDEPAERKTVRPSLPDSYEALFHAVGLPRFWLEFAKHPAVAMKLQPARLERAIGVVYRPETELQSHYFQAVLPGQFDEYVWFDETRAVHALPAPPPEGVPETYPFGL
jgi:erythromycin esterase-like protein